MPSKDVVLVSTTGDSNRLFSDVMGKLRSDGGGDQGKMMGKAGQEKENAKKRGANRYVQSLGCMLNHDNGATSS